MTRVRKPSPEQWTADMTIVRSAQALINTLAPRYNSGELRMASRCIDEFVQAPVPTHKPRVRKAVPAPDPKYRDGKSAAAHDVDARELAHHSV